MRVMRNLFLISLFCAGCGTSRLAYNPFHKFSPKEVAADYTIFEDILKQSHPGLYWYTPADSMEAYFNWGRQQLKDSVTEPQFRKILSYVTAKIDCGHTSVKAPKRFVRFIDSSSFSIFPLSLKLWKDTAVVVANLISKDTVLKRGTVITSINKKRMQAILDTLFRFLPADGKNDTHKYQTLSNRGAFGSYYSSIFGNHSSYLVGYVDSNGHESIDTLTAYFPFRDSLNRITGSGIFKKRSKRERKQDELQSARSLELKTNEQTAFMDVNTFSKGYRLKRFFRRSFRLLRRKDIHYLVIDVRGNGGGNVMNSTLLTKFLVTHPFKLADSLYALSRRNNHSRYIQNYFFNRLFMDFATRKRADGYYHFGYFERHYFKPKKKNHFSGQTFVLTGGNSFSATALFAQSLKNEPATTLVGEETGGGAYGNSAWLIPDVVLPHTKTRFRLPLFRLVINKNLPKNGRGVQPEVEVFPTVEAIKNGEDYKMNKAIELIQQSRLTRHP